MAQLGTAPDEVIAAQIGKTVNAVRIRRQRAGIARVIRRKEARSR